MREASIHMGVYKRHFQVLCREACGTERAYRYVRFKGVAMAIVLNTLGAMARSFASARVGAGNCVVTGARVLPSRFISGSIAIATPA